MKKPLLRLPHKNFKAKKKGGGGRTVNSQERGVSILFYSFTTFTPFGIKIENSLIPVYKSARNPVIRLQIQIETILSFFAIGRNVYMYSVYYRFDF